MALIELAECILRDKAEIHPVTVNIKGYHDVPDDLFLSVPAVISHQGVSHITTANINPSTDAQSFVTVVEHLRNNIDKTLARLNVRE